jgi:hypothetical protein
MQTISSDLFLKTFGIFSTYSKKTNSTLAYTRAVPNF